MKRMNELRKKCFHLEKFKKNQISLYQSLMKTDSTRYEITRYNTSQVHIVCKFRYLGVFRPNCDRVIVRAWTLEERQVHCKKTGPDISHIINFNKLHSLFKPYVKWG
jgi:hypothetical protein